MSLEKIGFAHLSSAHRPESLLANKPDLLACDREQIQIPGAIQAHGALLVLCRISFFIEQVSENISYFFAANPQYLVGNSICALGEPALTERVGKLVPALTEPITERLSLGPEKTSKPFDVTLIPTENFIFLELEPVRPFQAGQYLSLQGQVSATLKALARAPTLLALCETAASHLQGITGFDRVIVYRFDPQWNGEVLAESRIEDAESFLGLRFPASDIPAQARALYTIKTSRYIPDVYYIPSPLFPKDDLTSRTPRDLSLTSLRSISPVHLEYLRNMGLTASMSVSLIQENQLWGLISFAHTKGPCHLAKEVLNAVDLIREVMNAHLIGKVGVEDLAGRRRVDLYLQSLAEALHQAGKLREVLWSQKVNLLALVEADGAALIHQDDLMIVGQTPGREAIQKIIKGLALTQEMTRDGMIAVHDLPQKYPELSSASDIFCGVLMVQLRKQTPHECLVYFRKELIHTVNWGGDPNKSNDPNQPTLRIHPRKSFALWQEEVRGQASVWRFQEKRAAVELRLLIVDHLAQQTGRLEAINSELIRSNLELDSFAHAASHDLKEPLRGIQHYTQFILREEQGNLSSLALKRLDTVTRLTIRMNDLLDSLLLYAQVGRSELCLQENDLNQIVGETIEMLRPWLNERNVAVKVSLSKRLIFCDSVRVMEIFSNLITNAAKYNLRAEKKVEIGCEPRDGEHFYFVRDNGIGIAKENLELPFRLFKRLHPKEAFGGGAGTGLTLAKAIVGRHGGKIEISSALGSGTTIYFTLRPTPKGESSNEIQASM